MAQMTKNQKGTAKNSISREEQIRLSHIIAEESGCEDYTLERIEEHNAARKIPEKTQVKKLIWLATHKFVNLAFALTIVISGLVFTLIVGIATGFVGTVYLFGTIIGAFAGFVVGSFLFPLQVNRKNCGTCETLLSRRELYRKKLSSEEHIDRSSNPWRLVETTTYAVVIECRSCGERTVEVVKEIEILNK